MGGGNTKEVSPTRRVTNITPQPKKADVSLSKLTLGTATNRNQFVLESPDGSQYINGKNANKQAKNGQDEGPESVLLGDIFIFSDFRVEMTPIQRLQRESKPRKPYVFQYYNSKPKQGLKFSFSDFQVIVTENELNEDIMKKAGMSFSNISVKHLLEPMENKVDKLLNYEVKVLLGRPSRIKCLALSPDEKLMVACSHDEHNLVLYDLTSGKEAVHFQGHEDNIMCVAFSPEGKFVCSASRDETIIIWDMSTAKTVHFLQHTATVICCAYSPDGEHIVSGSQDKICRIWQARQGKELLHLCDHTALVISVAYSPDCRSVVSASADRSVIIWDARTGRKRYTLLGHNGIVLSCCYSPDNLRIISNDESVIKVWNARDGRLMNTFTIGKPNQALISNPTRLYGEDRDSQGKEPPAVQGAKRPDCKFIMTYVCPSMHLVTSMNTKLVQLFDINTGEEILSLSFRASVYACAIGKYRTLALGDANGNIYILRLKLASGSSLPPKPVDNEVTNMGD